MDAGWWQEAAALLRTDLSVTLLEFSPSEAAGFPQSSRSKKVQGRSCRVLYNPVSEVRQLHFCNNLSMTEDSGVSCARRECQHEAGILTEAIMGPAAVLINSAFALSSAFFFSSLVLCSPLSFPLHLSHPHQCASHIRTYPYQCLCSSYTVQILPFCHIRR